MFAFLLFPLICVGYNLAALCTVYYSLSICPCVYVSANRVVAINEDKEECSIAFADIISYFSQKLLSGGGDRKFFKILHIKFKFYISFSKIKKYK